MVSNNLTLGIFAHVDAGKTTLSEAVLYKTGAIRKLGRVDHKTAFLDTNSVEQERGITVFSKEARFVLGERQVVLVDTPGHVDFGSEAEAALQVLDSAILVISGADGVQGHTITLWNLLKEHEVPVFVFVNKMDQPGTDADRIMNDLVKQLGNGFVAFEKSMPKNAEDAAMCSEDLMEEFLESAELSKSSLRSAIEKRQMFPVCFGSALKIEGVDEFLETIETYAPIADWGEEFGARVYKISRDKHGARQTHLKITSGKLKSKMTVAYKGSNEKIEQIRLISGKTVEAVSEVSAGTLCAVTGLSNTYIGQGLGVEEQYGDTGTTIEPTLSYKMILPKGTEAATAMQDLRKLDEENPAFTIEWNEQLQEIQVKVTGSLELEILQRLIKDRLNLDVAFDSGSVIYKETIAEPVVGIGHFEPLRHYAEVHLLMEPLPAGSGLIFDTMVSEDVLDRNWQRLIFTHLQEREHCGVLTGSPITDMKITIAAGRAHLKHTEGGDFRQATYRAIRQGLKKAKSILLEPMYRFSLKLPSENVGRALTDLQNMGASTELPQIVDDEYTLIAGRGAVSTLQNYGQEVAVYTKGKGTVSMSFDGYGPCHNQDEVVGKIGYNSESDLLNPTGSIFCDHGSAIFVEWDMVDEAAHIKNDLETKEVAVRQPMTADPKELEDIFIRTYGKSKRDEAVRRERLSKMSRRTTKPVETVLPPLIKKERAKHEQCFIIDGYNVIFAWDELKNLADTNLDAAREALLEILQNYGVYKGIKIMVIFDGYKVSGNAGTKFKYEGVDAIFTKEAETADRFIEKTAYELGRTKDITVVTSDRSVQMAALGDGASRFSSREFYQEVINTTEEIREKLRGLR